jgi:hypothetical protein
MSESLHNSNISDSFASYWEIETLNDDREDDRNDDDHICAYTWPSQVSEHSLDTRVGDY